MRNISLKKSIIGLGVILVATIIIWQMTKTLTSAEPLSEQEALDIVEKMYSGKNTEVSLDGDVYKIQFEIESGKYVIDVDRETGDVTNLTKISQEPREKTENEIRDILAKEQVGEIKTIEKKVEQDQAFFYATVQKDDVQATYKLRASTGDIVDVVQQANPIKEPPVETEQPAKETPPPPKETANLITEEEAIQLALLKVKGTVDDVELEQEGGQSYYYVEIETAQEEDATVKVHAISGEVLTISWDD
ncbi:PepSY domain-containing protein [Ferdinandcohnia sp. Marseille-Q9671]